MNKERLFGYLQEQEQSELLVLLSSAFDAMDTSQRDDVFGQTIRQMPPLPVEGRETLASIEQFHEKPMSGFYYAPFDINSKNFSNIPEETKAWFDELGDYLCDSATLTDQGDHEMAVRCFELLHEMIDRMEAGDEIVFADEYGTWMIRGDEKRFVKSYLTSLSAISTPEEYAAGAVPLIRRDSHESFHLKVHATATRIANKDQKAYLKEEVKRQQIRTNPRD